jgi:hypothetical protein
MNRLVVGVVVTLMLVAGAMWTSGCGEKAATGTAGGAGAAKASTPQAQTVPQTDAEIAKVATTVPQSEWTKYPPDVQAKLKAYADAHSSEAGPATVPPIPDEQLAQMAKMPKSDLEHLPAGVRAQVEAYVQKHGGS